MAGVAAPALTAANPRLLSGRDQASWRLARPEAMTVFEASSLLAVAASADAGTASTANRQRAGRHRVKRLRGLRGMRLMRFLLDGQRACDLLPFIEVRAGAA